MDSKIKYTSVVDHLMDKIDAKTKDYLPTNRTLLLFGSPDSIFLKSIMKKADSFDIKCVIYQDNLSNHRIYYGDRIVVDMETFNGSVWHTQVSKENDLDGILYDICPCVTEAMIRVLSETNLIAGKSITIVGRGRSTNGLAEHLVKNDATVTIAHSKTNDLFSATSGKDVVLFCTPKLNHDISYNTRSLVIDLGGAVPKPNYYTCEYIKGIGKLTISILLNRLVTGIGISDFSE